MRPSRRALLLRAGLAAGALTLAAGHTPYQQWVVYRRRHLLVGCHRGDPSTYDLAKRAVALLEEHLPEAQARVARAPDARRLASLLGTEQLDLSVLGGAEAAAMRAGRDAFAAFGEIAVAALLPLGPRWLIAREAFPTRHGRLVTTALVDTDLVARTTIEAAVPPLPWHSGTRAFLAGEGEPPPVGAAAGGG